MRRILRVLLALGVVALGLAAPAFAGGQPVDTLAPVDTSSPSDSTPTTVDASVSTLPKDCTPPAAPSVVFVGRIIDAAGGVGRFVVTVIRSDPQGMLAVGRPVDVRVGNDLRFLVYNQNYLVAAEHTPDNALRSKVRQPLPVFGGDQVVGVDDFGAKCPSLSDPIVIRNDDGSAVDTGVVSSFLDDKRGIALAFLKPTIGVALAVIAIWALKRLVGYATKGLSQLFGQR